MDREIRIILSEAQMEHIRKIDKCGYCVARAMVAAGRIIISRFEEMGQAFQRIELSLKDIKMPEFGEFDEECFAKPFSSRDFKTVKKITPRFTKGMAKRQNKHIFKRGRK